MPLLASGSACQWPRAATARGYLHVPTRPVGDALAAAAKSDWALSAEAFADRVEAVIEAHAPGFRKLVWPPDLDAGRPGGGQPNVVAGDINGGSFAVDQQPLFRPDWTGGAGAPRERACTWPAPRCRRAPVHGACGDLAARQALADQHRPARLAAAASSAWPWPPSKPPGNAAKDEPPGGMHAGNGSRVDEPPRRRPSAFSWS